MKEKRLINSIKQRKIDFKEDFKYREEYDEKENMKHTLSDNLYSINSHFIYELIQNAEDNSYKSSSIPTLSFIVTKEGILTQNNEIGFNEENINSICKFSTSSKKGQKELGYIGEKGLGFKSVFAITDKPSIFSNGYQFYFPFQSNFRYRDDIEKKIRDIEPIVLLFLSKLKSLQIFNKQKHLVNVNRSSQVSYANFEKVSLEFNNSKEIYFLVKKIITKPAEIDEPKRDKTTKREIVLAFPALDNKFIEDRVFSFLPTEMKTGLPFLIQSDFILIGNRENIIQDNDWNLWLLDELVDFFVIEFPNLKEYDKYNFLKYLANKNSTHAFIDKYYNKILDKLKHKSIFLTNENNFVSSDRICILEDYNFMIEYMTEVEYVNSNSEKLSFVHPKFYIPKYLNKVWDLEVINRNTFIETIASNTKLFSLIFRNNNSLYENLISYLGDNYKKNELLIDLPIIPIDESEGILFYSKNQLEDTQLFFKLDNDGVLNDVFTKIKVISKKYCDKIEKISYYNEIFGVRYPSLTKIIESIKNDDSILKNTNSNIKLLNYVKNHYQKQENDEKEIIDLVKENYYFLTKNNQLIKQFVKIKNYWGDEYEYESRLYISSAYLDNDQNIEKLINKYCVNKFSPEFDFISERYMDIDKQKTDNLDSIKKEWMMFFEKLDINDSIKLVAETLEMGAHGSQQYHRKEATYKNIPFIAKGVFNYSNENKQVNIKLNKLNKEDSIFLFRRICEINEEDSTYYDRVVSFYRNFNYEHVDVPWKETIKNIFPIYFNDIRYQVDEFFQEVDKEISSFFYSLPEPYVNNLNNTYRISRFFFVKESPKLKDIVNLISSGKINDLSSYKVIFKYLHFKFPDDTVNIDKIPIINKNKDLIFINKKKLIWENGDALNLINLSSTYNSDFKQFFINQVGIKENPSVEQYLNYLGGKSPKNYIKIFNQFVISLEKIIEKDEAPDISKYNIFHINNNSFNVYNIIYNDEDIKDDTLSNLFSVQKRIKPSFDNIAAKYNITKLSSFKREIYTSEVSEDNNIQHIYWKLLNFTWDYVYSKSAKRFKELKANKDFIINTNNVNNGATAKIVLRINVNDKYIDIPRGVVLEADSIYVSNDLDERKIPTELSKFIGDYVDIGYEKIERFYDKVYKHEEYSKVEYYKDEEIELPKEEDCFDVVFKKLKQLNKESILKKVLEKTYTGFSNEKNEGNREKNNSTDDTLSNKESKNFSYDNEHEELPKTNNDNVANQDIDSERKSSLSDAVLSHNKDVPINKEYINPDIVQDIEKYKKEDQKRLDANKNRYGNISKIHQTTKRIKEGKKEAREFLKKQYKGHCQVCGFTFNQRDNKGNYFQLLNWRDKIISKQKTNIIEAGGSLSLCSNCHAGFKHGDFNAVIKKEISNLGDLNRLSFSEFANLLDSAIETNVVPDTFSFIELDMYKIPIRLLNKERNIFYTEEHFLQFFNLLTLNQDIQETPQKEIEHKLKNDTTSDVIELNNKPDNESIEQVGKVERNEGVTEFSNNEIGNGSRVKIKYLNTNQAANVMIVRQKISKKYKEGEYVEINNNSPLALALIGHCASEIVKMGGKIEILIEDVINN